MTQAAVMAPEPTFVTPPRRRRWLAVVLSLAVFLAGGVVGAGVTMLVAVEQIRDNLEHPERVPPRIAGRIASQLDLTDAQRTQVQEIVTRRHARIMEVREEYRPRIQQELEASVAEIEATLTPAQAALWRQMVEEFRAEFAMRKRGSGSGGSGSGRSGERGSDGVRGPNAHTKPARP